MSQRTLLIVDDEAPIVKNLKWAFKDDYNVLTAGTADEAMGVVRNRRPGLMVLDLSLTGDPETLEGFHILEEALLLNPNMKVIVVTGHDERDNALTAVEKGAYDFYAKPIAIDNLRVILERAARIYELESELDQHRKQVSGDDFAGVIAMSSVMQDVFTSIKKIAPSDVSVLVTGESGTGKELIARAIHDLSDRRDKPFAPINCGAIPENLLESELFGHEKGSFTGAHMTRPGKFEVADGGTVFLDEIGELSPPLQVKLLRFLQDQTFERIGGRDQIQVSVRMVAATNQDLEALIADKQFREDLFYRINAIRIVLPPLRERGDDILLLATRFLHRYNGEFSKNVKGYGDAALEAIHNYAWPGNVRELENRVKRAVLMAGGKTITVADLDLPGDGGEESAASGGSVPTLKHAREELEHRLIVASLLRNTGNVSATAKELDVSRPTLHDLMKKHGIDPHQYRASKE